MLSLVAPSITKQDSRLRNSIEPGLKLAVTFHNLAESVSHKSIVTHYRLGRSTVSETIYDACQALYAVLQPIYMTTLQSPDDWKYIAQRYITLKLFY